MRRSRPSNQQTRARKLLIIYEDADLLIVNKPPGLLTSTGPRERRPTLLAQVQAYLVEHDPHSRCGLIHRLDRDASGLLVFSKNNGAYHALKSQFFVHSVTREYIAVVEGSPTKPTGEIQSHLVERADGTVYSTRQPGKGQAAVTQYELVQTRGGRSVLRVKLHTGRKHQIRVHLSERGLPIVGDCVYGTHRNGKQAESQLLLAAITLGFDHPRHGKLVRFTLPTPRGFLLTQEDVGARCKPAQPNN